MMEFVKPKTATDLIILKNNERYALPVGWGLSDVGSYEFNAKLADKAFAHGSYVQGDKKLKGRTLTVKFDMKGITEAEHDYMVNLAYEYFTQTDYELYCGRFDRMYQVSCCSKIKHSFHDGFKQRWSDITVSLLLANPFRMSASYTEEIYNMRGTSEGQEVILNCLASADVPLILQIEPLNGKTTPDLTFKHINSGEACTLKDALLTAPAVAVINAEVGTVRRDSGNAINAFSGQFLHAKPGKNTYVIKGSGQPFRLVVKYRGRWFI